ncbi:hypothetical protein Cri9333_0391 [Crinalium epipsammum PCC 9333]|uniref:Uncharacterized protein n=1 Tax=Crinalium epipsammum PCC 9333 TaxID=1173022 RepID=K9VW18_9CYAN|nr:hypothetical protein [Crinalium epipsammum]AFZ11365.1 hypothetical protein Cri9333_0391 [Crinalium epipsammum PCC 9333]
MERLGSGYIARAKEIGIDFYPKIAADKSLVGETQDFYQGLLAGFHGAMRLMKVLPDRETFDALNSLEIKLATLINVDAGNDQIASSSQPRIDSVMPDLSRLDKNVIEQLKQDSNNISFNHLIENLVVSGETQDFYQGCLTAVNFSKDICHEKLAFVAIGLMGINLAGYVELEKEFTPLPPLEHLTAEEYLKNISKYSTESVDSGFVRYESSAGAGVIARFSDWDVLDGGDSLPFTVYSYSEADPTSELNLIEHLLIPDAATDFMDRVQHLGGKVDDVQFFTSDRRKKKLYATLESVETEAAGLGDEFEILRRQQIATNEARILEEESENEISRAEMSKLAGLDDEGFEAEDIDLVEEEEGEEEIDWAALNDLDAEVLLEQEFEKSELVKRMQNLLVESLLQDISYSLSPEDFPYKFDVVPDWMIFLEDDEIKVLDSTDDHNVFNMTFEGEIIGTLSYPDALELNTQLERLEQLNQVDDEQEQEVDPYDVQALLEEDDSDINSDIKVDSSSDSEDDNVGAVKNESTITEEIIVTPTDRDLYEEFEEIIVDDVDDIAEEQKVFAEQILPIAAKFQLSPEDVEGILSGHEVRSRVYEYELVSRKQQGVSLHLVVEPDGRGELIEVDRNGEIISAKNLTQQDVERWQAINEQLETELREQSQQRNSDKSDAEL